MQYNVDMCSQKNECKLCPRECKSRENGYCGGKDAITVAKIMAHFGEEPIISGTNGSGAIFFSGCSLRCVYCQNVQISTRKVGKEYSESELLSAIVRLADSGVHNINLVTAGHYLNQLLPVLEKVKKLIDIPIIYNTSSYEKVEALQRLAGIIDVYLPDFKYFSNDLSKKYSSVANYCEIATSAIKEMVRQQPKITIGKDGTIANGVIIRHLVLPSHREDSKAVIRHIASEFSGVLVSIMRQYTPTFNRSCYENLNRKVTSFEYNSIVEEAKMLSLDGYFQHKGCETEKFTPNFDENNLF